jgi:hypothetical protein
MRVQGKERIKLFLIKRSKMIEMKIKKITKIKLEIKLFMILKIYPIRKKKI